ncbi:MAG: hypothetical protein KDK70_36080, partial [Myxococcales bacterium]|nr:hypothetical protein [Myxococcales bacterium]
MKTAKTHIEALQTTDGYLREAPITFAEGLTCIIGARGTCKSTIVETLRLVHDLDRARIEGLVDAPPGSTPAQGPRGLLRETLAGGSAVCSVRRTDEHGASSVLRLERSIDAERPRIYRDD